jgi:arsenical pump membrane protein
MWLPNLVAIVVNFAIFRWLFRDRLPDRFEPLADDLPAADWWLATAAVVLAATLAALVALGLLRLPLAWAALGGGAILLVVGLAGRRVRLQDAVRAISWPLFVFVVGMFLIVRGFEHVWLSQLRLSLPTDPLTALALAAGGNAVGSNVVNNVPMTLLSLSLIAHSSGAVREALAYGTLVGANVGPTLTTFGSLATMLWLALIRKRGLDVSSLAYARIALLTTPAVLVAATIALWLVLR